MAGFWNVSTEEPLRQFRWFIQFGTTVSNLDDLQYALKKCDKPKVKINTVQHKYLNHFFNYPGRAEWEDINMTFASVQGGTKTFYDLLTTMGYKFPTTPDTNDAGNLSTISKDNANKGIGAKCTIKQINAAGEAIERFELVNAFFTNISFGTLDYSSEDIVEITCTVKYDSANLNTNPV